MAKQIIPVTAEHRQQMHQLRQWARKQGDTHSGLSNQAQAQVRASAPPQSGSPDGETPAPDTTPEGSD